MSAPAGPRLRTWDKAAGMTVEVNGVPITVEEWTVERSRYLDAKDEPVMVSLKFAAYLDADDPEPQPVTHEQVVRGEKSLNDYRRYLGMQPLADDAPTEPQPDTTAPITINVHVEGSVLSEKKLQDVIASQLGRVAAMRGLRW